MVHLSPANYRHGKLSVAVCENCGESTVWWESRLIFPAEVATSKSEGK
jgi:hypothetical protein